MQELFRNLLKTKKGSVIILIEDYGFGAEILELNLIEKLCNVNNKTCLLITRTKKDYMVGKILKMCANIDSSEKIETASEKVVQCIKQINSWKIFIYSGQEFPIGNLEQYISEKKADYLFIQNLWQSRTINPESLKSVAIRQKCVICMTTYISEQNCRKTNVEYKNFVKYADKILLFNGERKFLNSPFRVINADLIKPNMGLVSIKYNYNTNKVLENG